MRVRAQRPHGGVLALSQADIGKIPTDMILADSY